MFNRVFIIFIMFISLMFIVIEAKEDEKEYCYYSIDNSINLVEDNNKCFEYEEIKKNSEKKLMIVAHPDDETIFGGAHLLNDKYTVVCVTCGVIDFRVVEFEEVMSKTNDDYIMLGFTDRIDKTGTISDWYYEYNDIYNTLNDIIKNSEWDLIITHNPNGEYGHIHHMMLSEMVTNITNKNNLYYFGHWYPDGGIGDKLNDEIYNRKMDELISIYYRSQGIALNYNYDILPYENWIKATEW